MGETRHITTIKDVSGDDVEISIWTHGEQRELEFKTKCDNAPAFDREYLEDDDPDSRIDYLGFDVEGARVLVEVLNEFLKEEE